MRRRFHLFFLVLLGLCLGLVLAEAALRLFFPSRASIVRFYKYKESERGKFTRYDPILGWDGLERADDDFEWMDCRHHVKQNRYGYRGAEYALPRTSRKRIVVLGDSFVWGFGVEDEDIFTSVMERKTGRAVEVVNMGVSGYDNGQEYLLWRNKGRVFKPDDVILMVTPSTDFFENWWPKSHGYPKPVFRIGAGGKVMVGNVPVPRRKGDWSAPKGEARAPGSGLLRALFAKSAFFSVLVSAASKNRSLRDYLVSKKVIPERMPGYDWEYPLYMASPDAKTENGWRLMFKLIGMMGSSVKGNRATLHVAIVPSIIQVYPELWGRFTKYPSIPGGAHLEPEAPNRRIVEWCRAKNIEVIDLLPGLRDAGADNPYLYYPVNRHWTKEGHTKVAEILLQRLGY